MMQAQKMQDAFGEALMACHEGKENDYAVERDDGYLDVDHLTHYFAEFDQWSPIEKEMSAYVSGSVLDVGCGAGRHSLYLQNHRSNPFTKVISIDNSPLACCIAKRRGVMDVRNVSIDDLVNGAEPTLVGFDSVIMMGHNIGLLHGFREGKNILAELYRRTSEKARIIGTTRDPYSTTSPDHLRYQEEQRKRDRMSGQIKLRIRYHSLASDWMDYLFASEDELRQICDGTGWRLEATSHGDGDFNGPSYLAVLSKIK